MTNEDDAEHAMNVYGGTFGQKIQLRSSLSRYAGATPRWLASVGIALAVAVAYFLSARLGLALLTVPDGVAVFWPAAGVSAGALIALGRGARWPVATGVVAATIAANLLGDRDLWSASVFGVCNAAEALIAATLIERYFGQRFDLDRLSHVLGFFAATIVGTTASGIGGTLGYVWFHTSATPVLSIWYHWFASDALGIIAVAPLLIGFASIQRRAISRTELAEAGVALALITLVTGFGVFAPWEPWALTIPLAVSVPLFLWLTSRCAPIFTAAAIFLFAIAIVWTTTFGIGLFAIPAIPPSGRISAAQAGLLAMSLCALVLAALFAERHRHERALEKSEERLRLAVAASHMGMFDWDLRTGTFLWSDEWYRMLGYEVGEVEPSQAAWMARIHPDDRKTANASRESATRDHREFSSVYRIVRPDGDIRWIQSHGRFLFEAGRPVRLIGLKQDITENAAAGRNPARARRRTTTPHSQSDGGRAIDCVSNLRYGRLARRFRNPLQSSSRGAIACAGAPVARRRRTDHPRRAGGHGI